MVTYYLGSKQSSGECGRVFVLDDKIKRTYSVIIWRKF